MIHRQTVNCNLLTVVVVLASIGVAVASDTTTTKEKPVIANSTILLFDASDSMGNVSSSIANASSSTSANRKIDNAKTAVKTFISGLDPATSEVALIVFYDCGKIVILEPFTTKQSAISSKIDMIRPTGYTPLSAAIDCAVDYMNQSADGSKKKIILFTDGEETCPYKAIRKGKDIELSIIGFDIRKGSNQETKLQEFAKKVGGTYLSAEDASSPTALTKVLQRAYAGGGSSPLNYARVWFEKGYALQNMGRHDEAIQAYDKAIEIDPNIAME
jgi:Mg-chelatase subunit ChlD